jgi:large subunit ribosomal protein L29
MPIVRLKEMNDMSPEDRTKKLAELRAELSRMRTMISAGGAVENPTRVRELRRTIAQILTIEHEFKLGIRKTAGAAEAKKPKAPAVAKPAVKPKETKETAPA